MRNKKNIRKYATGGLVEEDKFLKNWFKNRKISDPHINEALNLDRKDLLNRISQPYTVNRVDEVDKNVQGRYENNTILLNKNADKDTALHEDTHRILAQDLYTRTTNKDVVNQLIKPKNKLTGDYNEKYDYYSNSDEVIPRLMNLRREMKVNPKEVITPKHVDKFMKTYKGNSNNINDLQELFDSESIVDLLNLTTFNDTNTNKNNYMALGGKVNTYDTELTPEELIGYNTFAQKYAKSKNFKIENLTRDYDLQGYYKKHKGVDLPEIITPELHLNDEFKKPNHITFSNGSIYSTPEHTGGQWKNEKEDESGAWSFIPTEYNLKNTPTNKLQEYFNTYEKGSNLILPNMRKKYAFGGQTNSTINAEGGEILQTPQGQVGNINGATHANGGVNLNVPNGSLIFSDRIGIKDNKGKFSSLADRKRIRENTLARLGKRQRDPFQINTIARTGQKLDQEEQADVALQTMVRNAIEGRGNLNSNVDSNEVPKAAWGTGDYINTGMNILGSFMNKSNVEKSIASTSQPMPNFNKNYGTAGLEKLRGASEDLKTQGTYAQNIINSQLQQGKQDSAAGIDNMGGSINLRRALRSKSANDVNQVYGDTMTKLNSEVLGAQTQLAGQEATMLNARDVALAGGEKAKFEYDTALARSNAGASNAASNELIGSIGGIGKSISESNLQDRQTELMNNMLMIQGEGKFGFTNGKFGPINNTVGANTSNWGTNLGSTSTLGDFNLNNYNSIMSGGTKKQPSYFALGGEVGGKSNPLLDMLSSIKREPITFANQTTTPEPDLNTGFVNELGGTNAKIKQLYDNEQKFSSAVLAKGSKDVERALATIRGKESSGRYNVDNKAGASSASGAYQFTKGTWKTLSKRFGIGTEYSKAGLAPPEIQDAVARKYLQDILKRAGGDVSKVPLEWYTGNIYGKISQKALAANNGMLPSSYQRSWMKKYNSIKS